jgi:hypothetical protein
LKEKDMKHQSLFLLIVAAVISLGCIVFLGSGEVVGGMCGAFLAAASAYTALDLRAVVRSTKGLPDGEYQSANLGSYYLAIGMMAALFVACLIKQSISGLALDIALGFLGPGIVGLIAIIIGGLKCNKAETGIASAISTGTQAKATELNAASEAATSGSVAKAPEATTTVASAGAGS